MVIDRAQLGRGRARDVDWRSDVTGRVAKISVSYACAVGIRTDHFIVVIDSNRGALGRIRQVKDCSRAIDTHKSEFAGIEIRVAAKISRVVYLIEISAHSALEIELG